jgi:hypothetical protein
MFRRNLRLKVKLLRQNETNDEKVGTYSRNKCFAFAWTTILIQRIRIFFFFFNNDDNNKFFIE